MNSLVDENKDDKHVWVYDFDGKILGIFSFIDVNSCFYMDVIASNELFPELCDETRPGFSLFSTLEDIARNLGHSYIRLDSVSYRVEYWKSYGYQVSGMPKFVEKWGQLYPMEKNLAKSE